MAKFVLVHGAFHGGWCYRKVAVLLRSKGHEVFTPTLTGLGERAHLSDRPINLSTHVDDVCGVLQYEDLQDVVLVGHSYGGMVVTGTAVREGSRVKSLVYLDAILPEHNCSLFDMIDAATVEHTRSTAVNGWVPCPPLSFFNVNPADAPFVSTKVGPHPLACFEEKLQMGGAEVLVPHRTYICADAYDFGQPSATYARLQNDPDWRVACVSGGHDLMIDSPENLAAVLLGEVER